MPSVLILGATSGIGKAVAAEFARRGKSLVLAARDRQELDAVVSDLALRHGVPARAIEFDALDEASRERTLQQAWELCGESCAGVVTSIGYLGSPKRAERDWIEARRVLDVNFTAHVALLQWLAQQLTAQGSGYICVISSVAGDRGRQSNALYCAAKGGLNVYLQALRNRLYHAGIRVITVKPGYVDTGMTYGKPGMFLVGSPERVAKDICHGIDNHRDVIYTPWFWRFVMLGVRWIPERVFKRLRL